MHLFLVVSPIADNSQQFVLRMPPASRTWSGQIPEAIAPTICVDVGILRNHIVFVVCREGLRKERSLRIASAVVKDNIPHPWPINRSLLVVALRGCPFPTDLIDVVL